MPHHYHRDDNNDDIETLGVCVCMMYTSLSDLALGCFFCCSCSCSHDD